MVAPVPALSKIFQFWKQDIRRLGKKTGKSTKPFMVLTMKLGVLDCLKRWQGDLKKLLGCPKNNPSRIKEIFWKLD